MSVARAEARLATALLVELLAAVAEDEDRGDEVEAPPPVAAVARPVAAAA